MTERPLHTYPRPGLSYPRWCNRPVGRAEMPRRPTYFDSISAGPPVLGLPALLLFVLAADFRHVRGFRHETQRDIDIGCALPGLVGKLHLVMSRRRIENRVALDRVRRLYITQIT